MLTTMKRRPPGGPTVSFSSDLWENDIALVKLHTGILSRRHTDVVELPPATDGATAAAWPEEGDVCVAKGWGCTQAGQCVLLRAGAAPRQVSVCC